MTGLSKRSIAAIALLVPDYDTAITYYVDVMGFELVEDTQLSPTKRWVQVSPSLNNGPSLLLAQADSEDQRAAIGKQAGDRVFLFLNTDNFERDYHNLTQAGVQFLEEPRYESYGSVAVFQDVFGNKWDLIERKSEISEKK